MQTPLEIARKNTVAFHEILDALPADVRLMLERGPEDDGSVAAAPAPAPVEQLADGTIVIHAIAHRRAS